MMEHRKLAARVHLAPLNIVFGQAALLCKEAQQQMQHINMTGIDGQDMISVVSLRRSRQVAVTQSSSGTPDSVQDGAGSECCGCSEETVGSWQQSCMTGQLGNLWLREAAAYYSAHTLGVATM